MPVWSNNDAPNSKPKFDVERQTREVIQIALYTNANTTANGTNSIQLSYNDGAQNNVANIGVSTGQYIYVAGQGISTTGLSGSGYPGFFSSNNTVASISGNTITMSSNLTSNIAVGTLIEFDKAIAYNSNKTVETTYNKDTILVTATRAANAIFAANTGNFSVGWVHVQKKTNNDGTVRYLKETLVALANSSASNTSSGNTSFGGFVSGV